MINGYSTFTGRLQRRGKFFYGMTAAQAARLQDIGNDESAKYLAHCKNLYTFTALYIQHARDLAKSGQKDEARNWFRFFTNAQIVSVLSDLKSCGDIAKLRDELNFLGLECHPLEPASFTTDIQAIRACLTEILSHVQNKSLKTKTVGRTNRSRTGHRKLGTGRPARKNFSAA